VPFQPHLFSASPAARPDLVDADVAYLPGFFAGARADALHDAVARTTRWRQETIEMYGRRVPIPRLSAWHGDEGCSYSYSKIEMSPEPWTEALDEIRGAVAERAGVTFNSVLANLYRDGNDSVAWHADDEPELGPAPVIASVSFGATRTFQLRHRDDPAQRWQVELEHGSLLIMRGPTQRWWRHRVPRTSRPVGARLNLTFRVVEPAQP
jgi:alkylated DNA repair dioxygenase AlkB